MSRVGTLWIAACVAGMVAVSRMSSRSTEDGFFRFGPGPDLVTFGVHIDTWPRYAALVAYCALNSVARTLHSEIVTPWIVTGVQHPCPHTAYVARHAYEVVMASVAYTWFDWFASISVLLSQVDVLLVEVACSCAMTAVTTHLFLRVCHEI